MQTNTDTYRQRHRQAYRHRYAQTRRDRYKHTQTNSDPERLLSSYVKGELNPDNKWKSDDLFYIIMNEIHPRFNQF